jgi:transcriptional regulator with XRE-family HTH domain
MEGRMTVQSGVERTEHLATMEKPFHFVDSGLSNIYLVGIRYFVYPDGKIIPEIPAIKQLMQLIARDLIKQESALTGDEIRFLRKRLGQKQIELSRAIGIEPETLSRAENDHQKLNESNDKLIRLYYALAAMDDANLADLRRQLKAMMADWHQAQYESVKKPLVAIVTNDEWQLQAA